MNCFDNITTRWQTEHKLLYFSLADMQFEFMPCERWAWACIRCDGIRPEANRISISWSAWLNFYSFFMSLPPLSPALSVRIGHVYSKLNHYFIFYLFDFFSSRVVLFVLDFFPFYFFLLHSSTEDGRKRSCNYFRTAQLEKNCGHRKPWRRRPRNGWRTRPKLRMGEKLLRQTHT